MNDYKELINKLKINGDYMRLGEIFDHERSNLFYNAADAIEQLMKSNKWLRQNRNSYQHKIQKYQRDIKRIKKELDAAVEVVHGQWDEERFAFCNVCSNCGLVIDRTSIKMHSGKFNYCPNCGAKMK